MIDEDKELVLRDLSVRLPYGVKVHWNGEHELVKLYRISFYGKNVDEYIVNGLGQPEPGYEFDMHIEDIKPYLRPLSTMTSEEFKELLGVTCGVPYDYSEHHMVVQARIADIRTKWFDKKMFDHRELIPKGLAFEAPEGMYKNETI